MSAIHGSNNAIAEADAPPVRTEAIGLLAAGLAHDLNNMLAAIVTTTELFASRARTSEDRADLQSVVDQASRASRLIRQLLAFSRQEMLNPVLSDPSRLVEDLRPMLATLLGRAISLDIAPAPPLRIAIDRAAFERILVNLVLNARNAILGTGRSDRTVGQVRIGCTRIGPHDLPEQGRPFMPPANYAVIAVEDDGPGIADAVAARIFEPYFTTRPDGQGLGLSSAFGLVKQSGGFLLHDRGPLGGARFRICLPEADRPVPPRPARASQPAPLPRPASGRLVLLAEDEMLLRMSAARGLERLGYRVWQATDGEAALARLEAERPSLLVSDIRMPGMDGIELARRARIRHPGLPVLLISGYADHKARAGLPATEASLLEKPFTMKGLEQAVQALL